jgi:hypothetical protein
MKMKSPTTVYATLIILFGFIIGYLDLHANEVQGIVLLLITFSAIVGLYMPRRAWLTGLLLGLSVFAAHGLLEILGYPQPYPIQPNIFASLLALVPAFIGAFVGAFIRNKLFSGREK